MRSPTESAIDAAAQLLAASERGNRVLRDLYDLMLGDAIGLDQRSKLAFTLLVTAYFGDKPGTTKDIVGFHINRD